MSVVVATRDRGEITAKAVRSILAGTGPLAELIIIDQSRDDRTSMALAPFRDDPRLIYRRSDSIGLARAHNEALETCQSELVAFTDDDCEASPGWLTAFAGVLALDDRIGVVFGSVLAAAHDRELGFVPSYTVRRQRRTAGLDPRRRIDGIGACMAIRRRTWEEVGGFDEMLGAGAPFRAADDGDFALRALAAGWTVAETPDVTVIHHGFRPWSEARDLIKGYARGTGAMMAKHLRSHTDRAPRLLSGMAWSWARGRTHEAARLDGAAHRWIRLGAFAGGFTEGLRLPVDQATCRYEPPSPAAEPGAARP